MPPFCNNVTSRFGGATCLVSHVFVRWVRHSFRTSAVNVDRNAKHVSAFKKQFCVPCAFGFSNLISAFMMCAIDAIEIPYILFVVWILLDNVKLIVHRKTHFFVYPYVVNYYFFFYYFCTKDVAPVCPKPQQLWCLLLLTVLHFNLLCRLFSRFHKAFPFYFSKCIPLMCYFV